MIDNEHSDDPLADRFKQLSNQISRTVDEQAMLDHLRHKNTARRRWVTAAVAAGVLLIIGGAALAWGGPSSTVVVANPPEGPEPLVFDLDRLCAARQSIAVTLTSETTPDRIIEVRQELAAFGGVVAADYLDVDETRSKGQPTFIQDPDKVETDDPDVLPRSLWLTLTSTVTADQLLGDVRKLDGVASAEVGASSPCLLDGVFSTEGYRIVVGGEVVSPEVIQGTALNIIDHANDSTGGLGEPGFDQKLVSEVVANQLLATHGRKSGEPVTEQDVDEAISSSNEMRRLDLPGVRIDKSDAIKDPEIRQSIRFGIERSRGMSLVLSSELQGGTSSGMPEGLREWLKNQLVMTKVEAITPTGTVTDPEIVNRAFNDANHQDPSSSDGD